MSVDKKTLTSQVAPWSKGVGWSLIVVEGVVALLLGLFILFQPEQANVRFIQVIGGYLVATCFIALYRLITHKVDVPGEPGRWVWVGVGLVAGLIALLHPRMATIDTAAATTVLAVGMLLMGILGLYGVFATRAQAGIRWGAVIANALFLLFAFAVFAHNRSDAVSSGNLVRWVGILSTGAGALLIFYGLRRRRAAEEAAAALAAAEAPLATSVPMPEPTAGPTPEPTTVPTPGPAPAGNQPSQATSAAPQAATDVAPTSPDSSNVSTNGMR
jgi:uncharacterized membrane protein HdeD (DUF308 family)